MLGVGIGPREWTMLEVDTVRRHRLVHQAKKVQPWWVTRCGASYRIGHPGVRQAWTDASDFRCPVCFRTEEPNG